MSQTDYNVANASGASVRSDINAHLGAIATRNSGATAPSTTFAYQVWVDTTSGTIKHRNAANSGWLVDSTADESYVLSRSSNTLLDISDCGKTIIATSTFTQTLDAAATLTDGWFVNYRNDGTGIITIDPNGAETIDGATTLKLYTGESCVISCNGSSFKTTGRSTGLVLIERKVASTQATLDFTIGIDSAFDQYIVEMSDVVLDTDGKQLAIRASTDGGSSFLSTNEYQAVTICLDGSGTVQAVNTLNLQLGMMNGVGIGNAANEFFSGTVKLYAPSGTSRHKGYAGEASYYSAGSDNVVSDRFSGIIKTTSAVNAIRFLPWPTGAFNITTGIFTLYGMRKG